ncbi:hypothetical protein [Fretibacter rubidus]|uniref:FecR family protein n=1 Tax=Fretibacter rubidus TaxID=570162 RepID=UPI003529FB0A
MTFKYSISVIALLSIIALSAPASAQEAIGVNSAVKGDVTVQSGETDARDAIISDPIRLQDAVNTARSSTLQITLKDRTTFTVGPDCDLVIDTFVYDPAKADNTLSATVTKGMFRFMSGAISKSNPDAVTINSPVASLGIRGTIVEGLVGLQAAAYAQNRGLVPNGVRVDPAGVSLFILRGPGTDRIGNNNVGRIRVTNEGGTVDINEVGKAVLVLNKTTPPISISADNDETFVSFSEQLRTVPNVGPDTMAFNVSPDLNVVGVSKAATSSAGASASAATSGLSLPMTLGAIALGGGLIGVIASGSDDADDTPASN